MKNVADTRIMATNMATTTVVNTVTATNPSA
jgi:hypothetical protein